MKLEYTIIRHNQKYGLTGGLQRGNRLQKRKKLAGKLMATIITCQAEGKYCRKKTPLQNNKFNCTDDQIKRLPTPKIARFGLKFVTFELTTHRTRFSVCEFKVTNVTKSKLAHNLTWF